MADLNGPLMCSGDIHWTQDKTYLHKQPFPLDEARGAFLTVALAVAKRQGLVDDESLATVREIANSDFEAEVTRLIGMGSLKSPEDMLPASDLAAQVRALQAQLAEAQERAALEAAGIAPSILANPGKSAKAAAPAAATPAE